MLRLGIVLLTLLSISLQGRSDVAVIVSNHSSLGKLTREQVLDIYTGRLLTLPSNEIPLPMDLRGTPPVRQFFYQDLTGKSLPQINSYWARLLFSGQATPPRLLPDAHAMIKAVHENSAALGFIDEHDLSPDVKVLFVLPMP
ncbi:MAG: hypothetical protein HKM02_03005 [Pseudomonadales bacterium]|nr:hypothetical protein [Pseudomonadales bacterium]